MASKISLKELKEQCEVRLDFLAQGNKPLDDDPETILTLITCLSEAIETLENLRDGHYGDETHLDAGLALSKIRERVEIE